MKTVKTTMSIVKTALMAIVFAMLAVVLCFVVFASKSDTGFNVFGTSYLRVLTGSMRPTFSEKDIVRVDTSFAFEDLKVGDIITYRTLIQGQTALVTHRVAGINENGELITKGDNNAIIDIGSVNKQSYAGKVQGKSMLLSFFFSVLSDKTGYFLVVLLPGMACTVLDMIGFMSAVFFFMNARNTEILEKVRRWIKNTAGLNEEVRHSEYNQKFGKYKKFLESEGFYYEYMTDTDEGTLVYLSDGEIAVAPFSNADYIFTSLEVLKEQNRISGKKQLELPVVVPQSDKEDDTKKTSVKVITIPYKLVR